MASDVATAYVQIVPSARGISGGIEQAIGGDATVSSAGASIGGKLTGAIIAAITTAGLGAALGKTLTEGAALEQSIGGVETLFKGSASQVTAAADQAFRTAGVSANNYMEQVTSFSATLLQGLGGDTAAAAGYADKAIVQMSDNANKMGTDMSAIQYAYQGFAKDNYTMLDNLKLGYGGTQSEMARLINDSGVLGDSVKVTADTVKDVPFSSIIDAIGVIQDNLGITGTTAEEAATTLSGSFASMQAAASNVMANLTLGRDVGPALQGLAQTVTTFLAGNLLPAIGNILSALVLQVIPVGTQMLQSLGAGLAQGVPNFLAQALPMVLQFTETLRTNFGNIVDAGIDLLLNLAQGIANGLPTLIEYVPQIVTNIAGLINDNAPKLLAAGLHIIVTLGLGLIQAIPTLIANIPQIIQAVVSVFTAFNWISLGSNIITMLKNGITSMVSAVQSAGTSIFDAVKNAIANLPATLQSLGSNAITSMANGLKSMLGSVLSAARGILTGIVGIIKGLPGQLWFLAKSAASKLWNAFVVKDWNGLGTNIIQGIINGIGSMAGALWEAATNVAKSALNAIKSFFGIASPSKLMQFEIGPYIPQGLALGIEKNAGYVTDAMDDLGLQSTSRLRSTIAAGTPSVNSVGSQADHAVLDAINAAARTIVQAVQENGGEIVIGDDVIYRSFNRARQSQSIMLGGAY
jgi:phage-related protein|uniref:Tail tape measure protein n=1 Tax=Siphoviridae sp. ctQkH10 TaxID=2825494 RepID=A0A8S5P3V4_9CAUD|nr:MAG TPA: tail tape measure protein [Siphoviridae sp. ctQkH10]